METTNTMEPNTMNGEVREWNTHSVKHKVALVLISDGIPFRYNEVDGIVFSAPGSYVRDMADRLVTIYGCSLRPVIKEFRQPTNTSIQ